MELAGFQLLCRCLVLSIISSASGLSPPASSPGKIVAVAGKDVRLPCDVSDTVACSLAKTVEWLWTDGQSSLQVHILHQGRSLTKEQAEEYRGRTAATSDCSLTLRELRVRDAGTYRCVLRGSGIKEASVYLDVVEMFEVNLSVQRTSDNQLIIRCKSSSPSKKPVVSLLDSQRNTLTNQIESSDQPGGLYSVQVSLNLTAAAVTIKNGTLICRAEIPEMNLWNETKIDLTDEFHSSLVSEAARGHTGLVSRVHFLALGVVGVVIVIVLVLAVCYRKQRFAQISSDDSLSSDQSRKEPLLSEVRDLQVSNIHSHSPGDDSNHRLTASFKTEYGDIRDVDTVGASEVTARLNRLESRGPEASREMAKRDEEEMGKYKDRIIRVGQKLKVHPALIAGIISRLSQAGKNLRINGFGKSDPNCFGLMQINKAYHAVTGNPYSKEHVHQGVLFLIQLIKTMERERKDWTKEQQLKGALACYMLGDARVLQLNYEEIDGETDFASDVIARAQWFAINGY